MVTAIGVAIGNARELTKSHRAHIRLSMLPEKGKLHTMRVNRETT
jgi:hypothetical protein